MVRQPESFDDPDERLFRTLPADLRDGDRILQDAIDANGTSCYRERFCPRPEEALEIAQRERPHEDTVAAMGCSDLPAGEHIAPGGAKWEFYLEDLPTEDVVAHCEVRFRHPGKPGPDRARRGARAFLKLTLASAFRVVYPQAPSKDDLPGR